MKILALRVTLAACVSAIACQAHAADSITVGWFGGSWGDAFQACIATPFTAKTGITVVPEIGTSTVNLSKIEQQKSAPVIDAVWMDSGISELAYKAGVLDTIDAKAVPNIANLVDEAIYSKDGAVFAVSTGFYALGIAYNKTEIATPPTSWEDLWKEEYAGAVLLPSPANGLGVPTIYFLNEVLTPDHNMDATFEKLKALKAGMFFDSSGTAANAFQTGEVIIGAFNNAPTWDLNSKGVNVEFVVPKEGAWGGDVRVHLVKGAPNKALAEKFIDFALTKEASSCLADKLYLGPSAKDAEVSADSRKKMPWGADGSVKDLKFLDWWDVNEQRAGLVERWNREIARK
jgi:putative spermidine/putrescine transport system substrate-binding protein